MIFAFSGTGNSYHVARIVSEELGMPKIDIAAAVRYGRFLYDAKGEDVGFVFPVYFFGLPDMVRTFAQNLKVRNPGRVFAIATCAGESGGVYGHLKDCLGDRLELSVCYDLLMPENAVFYEDVPSREEAEPILEAADARLKEIIEGIKAGETGDRRTLSCEGFEEMYPHYDESRRTEHFHLNDRCIECRICEDVCPNQIIKIYHRKPVWDEETCSMCMCCLNLCPKKAIEFGPDTAGRGRYHHPDFDERVIGIPLKY